MTQGDPKQSGSDITGVPPQTGTWTIKLRGGPALWDNIVAFTKAASRDRPTNSAGPTIVGRMDAAEVEFHADDEVVLDLIYDNAIVATGLGRIEPGRTIQVRQAEEFTRPTGHRPALFSPATYLGVRIR